MPGWQRAAHVLCGPRGATVTAHGGRRERRGGGGTGGAGRAWLAGAAVQGRTQEKRPLGSRRLS